MVLKETSLDQSAVVITCFQFNPPNCTILYILNNSYVHLKQPISVYWAAVLHGLCLNTLLVVVVANKHCHWMVCLQKRFWPSVVPIYFECYESYCKSSLFIF